MMRKFALLGVAALTACSGGGTSPSPIVARAPIAASSAPASTSSQTRATFVIQWPAATQATSIVKRRQTLSPSTESISVSVNGGTATVVNKPTLSGSPSTTSVSIPAPPGSDAFTFTAWDQLGGTGAILDQTTATQTIVANANNSVTVVLDGVCAALVPTLTGGAASFVTFQNTTTPLVSGSRTILQSARLIGPSVKTVTFTRVDADGNTILTSAGVAPISVAESGSTPHVTIAPVAAGATNTSFTLTPIAAEPDGVSTTITATSPDCGTGTPTFPNSFQLSTSAEIVVSDQYSGLLFYDQDGTEITYLSGQGPVSGVAYNSKSGYLVTVKSNAGNGIAFQTLSPTGSAIGAGTFTPHTVGVDTNAATQSPGQIAYDSATGNFYLTLQTTATAVSGAVEEYSISGSTATYVAATDMNFVADDVDPVSIAVTSDGSLAVNDESTMDASTDGTDFTYTIYNSLTTYEAATGLETTSLSFDSTHGNTIGFTPYANSKEPTGLILNERLAQIGSFVTPEFQDTNITASAYNPGNDQLYLFDWSYYQYYGLSGATEYGGGSTTSNLPGNAFLGLYEPTQAVVLP